MKDARYPNTSIYILEGDLDAFLSDELLGITDTQKLISEIKIKDRQIPLEKLGALLIEFNNSGEIKSE